MDQIASCLVCVTRRGKNVELHHIIYRSRGGPDDEWNLAPLCRECHETVHRVNVPAWALFFLKGNHSHCQPCKFRRGTECGLWGGTVSDDYMCDDVRLDESEVARILRFPDLMMQVRAMAVCFSTPLCERLLMALPITPRKIKSPH